MVHVMRDTHPTTIGDEVTVGHSAVLHGCTIEDRVLIGMGAMLLNGVARRGRFDRGRRQPGHRRHADSAAFARDGPAGQGEARADRRRGREDSLVRRQLRGLPARLRGRRRGPGGGAPLMTVSTKPARGMRDFLPADVRRRAYVIDVVADVYPELRVRAARDARRREHRDAHRQVRRRRRPAHLQDPQARRRRQDRRAPIWRCATTSPCRWRGWWRSTGRRCPSSSSATRCSRCGGPTGRRRAASASSTSATSMPRARRR